MYSKRGIAYHFNFYGAISETDEIICTTVEKVYYSTRMYWLLYTRLKFTCSFTNILILNLLKIQLDI